jgi:MFS family permease
VLDATARRGPSALRFHNARLFVAGQGLSNIGTFSQLVALSLLVFQLTDSGLALGAVMAAQALPFMLLGPWAGPVLDRLPLRRVLLVTACLGATQAACLAVLAFTGTINLAWVFGLAIGLGCVQVFDRPGGQAFLAELVPREAVAGAVGLASSAQAIGRLGGPALGAVLYATLPSQHARLGCFAWVRGPAAPRRQSLPLVAPYRGDPPLEGLRQGAVLKRLHTHVRTRP